NKRTRVRKIIAIVSTSSSMKLKVQHLYYGSKLPKIFATSAKLERLQNRELWLAKQYS
ncbi:9058_t:CDS:1, partial [Gigaspora margarita]